MITAIVLFGAIGIAVVIVAAVLSRGLSNRSGIQRQRRQDDDSSDTTVFTYSTSDQTYDHYHPVDHGGSFSVSKVATRVAAARLAISGVRRTPEVHSIVAALTAVVAGGVTDDC